ncbi:MAG: N-acetyl-gamma-glutamyl-phosphate reductase, partial [Candidatus Omnitrophica bacterium]|nr:N-acetyl-gamma-glutamyl-phosphate reductase [Candidatus Omnitrophota bacterium]
MLTCSVVGATGYTGSELIRILAKHPRVKIVHLTTRSDEKIKASSLVSSLGKANDYVIEKKSLKQVAHDSDIVFLALPHTGAMDAAKELLKYEKVVIDLSADFRLRDARQYPEWYGVKHTQKVLLKESVYGLPEIYREEIRGARLIANPGCYPTGVVLGLFPLVKRRLINLGSIVVDSKSGVSGAGKKLSLTTHFSEVNENFGAYKVNQHQHMPEIAQVLNDVSVTEEVKFTFVPHLLPITRGLLSTIYAEKRSGVKPQEIVKAFREGFESEPFVRFRGEGVFPSVRDVQNTNFCDVGIQIDPKSGRVIVITA